MQLGYIGLGKMGKNMVLRLLEKGHDIVAWNRSPEPREAVATAGATTTETVEELVNTLETARTIWTMLPAGEVTDGMIADLAELLDAGDTIIDGANSNYNHTLKNAALLANHDIEFMDAGISGGPAGARHGACAMVGGEQEDFDKLEVIFRDISTEDGYRFFPGHGAGHFVKMVHNGIEYGMMQAIAEGFNIMQQTEEFDIDLKKVSEIYNRQSVIESRLVGWLGDAYEEYGQDLEEISGEVSHSGEGQWTVETAKKMEVPVEIIEGAFQFRLDSQGNPSYTGKVVSALRGQFGGHAVETDE